MKTIFFATNNKYKIVNMKNRLNDLDIKVLTPYDLNLNIDIVENGKNVIENATLKAKAYFEKINMPTIATDSSLYVEKFKIQPGLYVRRINGKYLNDKELEEYYIKQLDNVGGESKAYYKTGVVLYQKDKIDSIEIKEDEFIFTSKRFTGNRNNDALGRLQYDKELNKYFCQLTKEEVDSRNYIFDKEVRKFIKDCIEI